MSAKRDGANSRPVIDTICPAAAISGGEVEVHGRCLSLFRKNRPHALFGEVEARLVVGGPRYVVVKVPEEASGGSLVLNNGLKNSEPRPCSIGLPLADSLHPVANPAVDAEGNIFTTRSGTRGESVPVSVFKIDLNFEVKPVGGEIVNPTGLIFNRQGDLLISSRNSGTVYMIGPKGQTEVYAEGMGVATGMAFDNEENLYVGDRTGTIFKIGPDRQIFVFATLEPSIAAYHLVWHPSGRLFVTGPTTSSFDCVYSISADGQVETFYRGLGRPQGMVLDVKGRLYVAASHSGRKGVYRLSEAGEIEQVITGPGIVGLAFLPSGEMVLATGSSIYRVETASWIDR